MKHLLVALSTCALCVASVAHAQEQKPASLAPVPNHADLRLELAKVSLLAETGSYDDAYALLGELRKAYPNNAQVLMAEADLNDRTDNRAGSSTVLDKALALDPDNEDIINRHQSTLRSQRPAATVGVIFRNSAQADEIMERIAAQSHPMKDITASAVVENDHVDTDGPITRTNGAVLPFDGERQRGTFSLTKLYADGDELTGSLHGGNETVGAGLAYQRWDPSGNTRFEGNYQKPEWSFIESIIGNGTRDDVRLSRFQRINPNLQGTLGGSLRRYGLDDDDDVARSLAWDFELGYSQPYLLSDDEDDAVTLGVYYTVDGEYFHAVDTRTLAGVPYRPFPAVSYEVHSLNLSAARKFSADIYGEAYGGYAYDRLGQEGPVFGGMLEYTPVEDLELGIQFSRTLLGERGGEETDVAGLFMKWRW